MYLNKYYLKLKTWVEISDCGEKFIALIKSLQIIFLNFLTMLDINKFLVINTVKWKSVKSKWMWTNETMWEFN